MRQKARHQCVWSVLLLAALALALGGLAGVEPSSAQNPDAKRLFDIPAQPLVTAIARFATVSGVDIAYRQSLASGRRSSALHGEVAAPAALQSLLRGTGLAARFTGPRAAIIYDPGARDVPTPRRGPTAATPSLQLQMAEVRAPVMVGARDRAEHRRYAIVVQTEVREVLRRDGAYEGRAFRMEIRLVVDPAGVIEQAAVRHPSGAPAWDQHVVTTLTGRALPRRPPVDLAEPLIFEITSDDLADGRLRRRGVSP